MEGTGKNMEESKSQNAVMTYKTGVLSDITVEKTIFTVGFRNKTVGISIKTEESNIITEEIYSKTEEIIN